MRKFFFLPVNTGYYSAGNPTLECIDFYRVRSTPKLYCSIVGNIATTQGYGSNPSTGKMSSHPSWNKLADAISSNGTKPGVQIANCWNRYVGQQSFINPNWEEYSKLVRTTLKSVDLDAIFEDFKQSADIAIANGFEHIQIHAAHGYLLSSLIDPHLFDNAATVIERLRKLAGYLNKKAETSVRISNYCGFANEIELERAKVLDELLETDFSFFDLSEGYYNLNKNFIYPKTAEEQKARFERSIVIAQKYPLKNFILSSHWKFDFELPNNVSIGFCRNIIANPLYLENRNHTCRLCGKCHYYSRGKSKLSCSLWARKKDSSNKNP